MARTESGFTEKQEGFCYHYAACLNATKAALQAGYSEKTAYSIGSELLKKPEIKERIKQLLEEKTIQREAVLARLSEQATFDIGDITDQLGNIDFQKAREAGLTHVIKSIKRKTDKDGIVSTEYELYDAQAALVHLGRAYSLFTMPISGSIEVENKIIDLKHLTFDELYALKFGKDKKE